jgi:1-acyl-sn-glycerol-3-phosphate acyltransferase
VFHHSPIDEAAALPRARGFSWCWRVVLVTAAFGAFGVGALLLGLVLLPLVWLYRGPARKRRVRCQRVVGACFRFFHRVLRALGLVDFDVDAALENPAWQRERQVVLVANHPSLLENLAALAVAGPICCLAAPWLSRNPLLVPLLVLCGHVRSRDDTLAGKLLSLQHAEERLADGHSLLLFPEGTRSPARGLGEFQRGAFELAMRAGLPVLPISASLIPPVLTSGSAWYDLPDRAVCLRLAPLDVWEPLEYAGPGRDAKWLARKVREQLESALFANALPSSTNPNPQEPA